MPTKFTCSCRASWTASSSIQHPLFEKSRSPRRIQSIVYHIQHFNAIQGSNLIHSLKMHANQQMQSIYNDHEKAKKGIKKKFNEALKSNHHNSSLSSAGGDTIGRPESFAKSTPIFLRHFSQRAWKSFSIPLSI